MICSLTNSISPIAVADWKDYITDSFILENIRTVDMFVKIGKDGVVDISLAPLNSQCEDKSHRHNLLILAIDLLPETHCEHKLCGFLLTIKSGGRSWINKMSLYKDKLREGELMSCATISIRKRLFLAAQSHLTSANYELFKMDEKDMIDKYRLTSNVTSDMDDEVVNEKLKDDQLFNILKHYKLEFTDKLRFQVEGTSVDDMMLAIRITYII
jgi:hypothetical protein